MFLEMSDEKKADLFMFFMVYVLYFFCFYVFLFYIFFYVICLCFFYVLFYNLWKLTRL